MYLRRKEIINCIIALSFYAFMFLIIGSSFVLYVSAFVYSSVHPNVEYADLITALSGLADFNQMSPELLKGFSIVGSYGQLITYTITTVFVLIFMWKHLVRDFKELWNNILKFILVVFVSFILFYIVTLVVELTISLIVKQESTNQESIVYLITNGGAIPMFISVVILAPLLEELIYRKAIFTLFENKPIILPYIVSALVFSIPHMLSTQADFGTWILLLIPYLTSGFLLAGVYHASGKNVWASWAIHAANNFIAYLGIIMLMQM